MKTKEPQRPTTVPTEAIWNSRDNEWELGKVNTQGKHIGEWKWWLAPKGHLCCHTFFDEAGNIISFKRFHPNGEVSRYGSFEGGKAIEDVYLKSTESTSEVFAYGNTDARVWKAVKKPGVPVEFDYYDKEGNHLNPQPKEAQLPIEPIIGEEKIQQTKEKIYAQGKSVSKGELDDSFAETVFSLLKEEDEELYGMMEAALENVEDNGDHIFYKGDLHLETLNCFDEMEIGALIVDGNLTVDGSIYLVDDPLQLLFVTGDVVAKHVVTSGALVVNGNLTVKSCLLGDYNHGASKIFGNVSAHFFHPEEYFFDIQGESNFQLAFGNSWRLNGNERGDAFNANVMKLSAFIDLLHHNITDNLDLACKAYLDTPCKDEHLWEYLERGHFLEYVTTGRPVFKT